MGRSIMYNHETESAVVGKLISEKLWRSLLFGDKRVCAAIALGHKTRNEIAQFVGITKDTARERLYDLEYEGLLRRNKLNEYIIIDPYLNPMPSKTHLAFPVPQSKLMAGK